MSTRRRAREIVLQLLYEADVNDPRDDAAAKQFIRSRLQGRKALTEFAYKLFCGTLEHRRDVDAHLSKLASHWTLPRMAVTDRNILRLGGYEILYGDTPGRVAVNEAILLAKRYGDKNSPRFVNGVLDRLYKDFEARSASDARRASDAQQAPAAPRVSETRRAPEDKQAPR